MFVEHYQTIPLNFYTEGPAMDIEGNIYCTTLTGGDIIKIDKAGKYSTWANSSCPNGQVILSNGDHLVCDSHTSSIGRYNSEGILMEEEVKGLCGGIKVGVPNDLVIDKSEGIYFSDSIRTDGKIFYRSKTGKESVVATGLDYPNGLALSFDERKLFVAESYKNRIVAIELESPGVGGNDPRIIAELPRHSSERAESNLPDGIAIDVYKRIWIAHYGMQAIQVISAEGILLQSIEIPFPLVSNIFLSHDESRAIVTGGYAEPGPGAICILTIKH